MAEAARQLEADTRQPDRLSLGYTAGDAARLDADFEGASTTELLDALLTEIMPGELAVVSSFGTESAVLLDLVAAVAPEAPVLFLETGKHFPETLAYRDALIRHLGLTGGRDIAPDPADLAARDDKGLRWSYDPDGCCEIRKARPLARALARFGGSITGRKAFQAGTRAQLPRIEAEDGRLKINPLIDWTKDDIDRHFELRGLPRHPLEACGYPSIGCAPCTSKVQPGEDPRSGRWRGWEKTECGIHLPGEASELPSF